MQVEEHGLMSMSNLIKTIPNCLKKWPNLTYDASSKNSGLYDAEFILVEMLDCCLVVYHPYRPLTTMLQVGIIETWLIPIFAVSFSC
ncbi:hypothetical protein TELCIR_12952 [Teladorsagia circumcincta]|uniref:Uncharacterized protein n=1 Tax=Teladorsagia circumcincta TaxID=45464 RepID=A0A2G9U5E1_TELCI|nr:hypothetical protein TELCIR_12952 [Teladorsagia circumcincta]